MQSAYIPILKSKPGELQALKALPSSVRSSITPLIEVTPLSGPKKKPDGSSSTPRTLVKKITIDARRIAEAWETGDRPILIDTHYLASNKAAAMEGVLGVFKSLNSGIRVVPVVGANLATAQASRGFSNGACFRIPNASLYRSTFPQKVKEFLLRTELEPAQVDLLIDCGYISNEDGRVDELIMALRGSIPGIPHLSKWRTVALAGGSFPPGTSHLEERANWIPRLEWNIWSELSKTEHPQPSIIYSDYAIQNPLLPPSGGISWYSNIRYTVDNHWLVMKGALLNSRDSELKKTNEYRSLVADLLKMKEFRGADFSAGDAYISDCAAHQAPSHRNTKWREVGTSHHISTVLEQTSNSFASSGTP